mmetsp:Transcript_14774/g.26830  ORF Transcript_14774/g.26830 Transcript_14774/m.26830 type:complete len:420 (-) Transcript_14774:460-1719(-)|eukprot:CAMPEP_0201870106 /NCGR_PEP_ID=MMETSP0902-20130614/3344_1 /ASSEMBLY_ACC=CAM_ASM_000551 /TAXON_ID=420261 /ORGANISM="Thalassiosira antarctica, Strain CCMP982" /LENGTH=419 /DNA_ID=CAMNT_0048395681 /DNA_START=59 /DNA_END=1318 /DNA_ORIENTATION=+
MTLVRVISAEVPSSNLTQPATNDNFDRHNKPRFRRALILSALNDKYPQLVSFAKPPSSASSTLVDECDLVDLYSGVHDDGMIRFLVEAWPKWKEMGPPWDKDNCHPEWRDEGCVDDDNIPPLIPCHSAFRRDGIERPSTNVMGAMGYYSTDSITPIVGSLVKELQEDAAIICSAVDFAYLESNVVYAVPTHPGHHASRDCFGGYCYLNNAALCARLLQRCLETGTKIISNGKIVRNYWIDEEQGQKKSCRVAIIDIDYHCGNGTASIFYQDPNVFFTSIHCDPNVDYPWNAGHEDQVGSGEGEGTTFHIPLSPGATWEGQYKSALEKAMSAIVDFDAAALVVSLGLDTYEGDSVAVNGGGFQLKGSDYYAMGLCMGKYMAGKHIPCVFVQEGGYKMDAVGDAAADVVCGFALGAAECWP